jgi:hypothetical protein
MTTAAEGAMREGETFGQYIKRRLKGGVLRQGAHEPNGEACALEARSQALGLQWTDDPVQTQFPDIRPLNDAWWESDAQRTEHLVPVIEALWDWPQWDKARQQRFAERLAERTIREILPPALETAGCKAEAEACRKDGDEKSARAAKVAATSAATDAANVAAASAAAYATATRAAKVAAYATAANAAAAAANVAAYATAAAYAAGNSLIFACRIWRECAEESANADAK